MSVENVNHISKFCLLLSLGSLNNDNVHPCFDHFNFLSATRKSLLGYEQRSLQLAHSRPYARHVACRSGPAEPERIRMSKCAKNVQICEWPSMRLFKCAQVQMSNVKKSKYKNVKNVKLSTYQECQECQSYFKVFCMLSSGSLNNDNVHPFFDHCNFLSATRKSLLGYEQRSLQLAHSRPYARHVACRSRPAEPEGIRMSKCAKNVQICGWPSMRLFKCAQVQMSNVKKNQNIKMSKM